MILLQSHSRFLLQTLINWVQNLDKGVELDYHWVEFDDIRYHIQATTKSTNILLLSLCLPFPPPEAVFPGGLPPGSIEAIKSSYGSPVQILDPPRDSFNLTLKVNLSKLPIDEDRRHSLLVKVASVREIVLGPPLRQLLRALASSTIVSDTEEEPVPLVHRPKESFLVIPQADRVTVVFPMRFKDSIDIVLATSFLQEFVQARLTAGLSNAPLCMWSASPPSELKKAPAEPLSANAGFVTFGCLLLMSERRTGQLALMKGLVQLKSGNLQIFNEDNFHRALAGEVGSRLSNGGLVSASPPFSSE
ncbi:hypothetical protein MLD38_009918 [Melastoma candidum]|uniref:Uncharacterized protein n=1 Tax=Melastoma candidum TaxID=119954 RepID=A0ACB9QY49_9MYRT|nr:hypothetical protein MLD38_009918 [Melastoma candidum]